MAANRYCRGLGGVDGSSVAAARSPLLLPVLAAMQGNPTGNVISKILDQKNTLQQIQGGSSYFQFHEKITVALVCKSRAVVPKRKGGGYPQTFSGFFFTIFAKKKGGVPPNETVLQLRF